MAARSWLRFGRLGSILARNAFRSLNSWPSLSAAAVESGGDRAERLVEFGGVDFRQHRSELLEHGVDLDGDPAGIEHLAGAQALRRGVFGGNQLDELRAERRRRDDVDEDIGRQEAHPGRVDGQMNRRLPVGHVLDGRDGADRRAVQFDLGAGVHHQTRAIGKHGHRHGLGEAAAELRQRDGDDRDDDDDGGQARERAQVRVPTGTREDPGDRPATT